MNEEPKSKTKYSALQKTFFALACVATAIALFYAEEDFRGWHTWTQFKHQWEAKGERFEVAKIVPPPVPDDQNFAMTPIVYSSYGQILTRDGKVVPYDKRDQNFEMRMRMFIAHDNNVPKNCTADRLKGTFTPLEAWQTYYREQAAKTNEFRVPTWPRKPAEDVLLALSKYDSAIEELRSAVQLPESRYPVNYDNESPWAILLPHLAPLKGSAQFLQLRSAAELQNDQPDKALEDIRLGLQLTDKVRNEPFLISHLVRLAMLQLMFQTVWEGLAEHKWSDAQLIALDTDLAKFDFAADYKRGMQGELTGQADEMNLILRRPEHMLELSDNGDGRKNGTLPSKLLMHFIPSGWMYQNEYRCARMMEDYFIPVADVSAGTFSPDLTRRGEAALAAETKSLGIFNVYEALMLPALGNAVKKFAYGQGCVNLARTAIALERYRLAHGEFPESLDTLAPQFIAQVPHDVIGGGPLKYHRTGDGLFLLYSVGWNETDDNGVPAFGAGPSSSVDPGKGDWVWKYPIK